MMGAENFDSLEQKIVEVIIEQLSVDEGKVTRSASIIDDLGADSLDMVELSMALEEKFDIEVPDDVAEKITTVEKAFIAIRNLLAEREPQ